MNKKIYEVVYGIHPILELLKAKKRKITAIYTTKPEPKAFKQIKSHLPKYNFRQIYKTRQELTQLAESSDHQGIIVRTTAFQTRKKPFDSEKQRFVLMLDGIQDTRNLGAILRSAYCTGFQKIIITKKGSAPINASTLKASAGLAEHLEIYQTPSANTGIQELKKTGYNIYISALKKDAKDATKITFKGPLCLVIGSESTGVSKEILNKGQTIILPQKTADISYNASVAAGILLFIIATQQQLI